MRNKSRALAAIASIHVLAFGLSEISVAHEREQIPQAQESQNETWGDAANGYQILVESNKSQYSRGEPIKLSITTKNVDSTAAPMLFGPITEVFAIRVKSPANQISPRTLYGDQQAGAWISGNGTWLSSQESHTRRVEDLSRCFDMTLSGVYSIDVRLKWAARAGGKETIETVSNPITLTITDRPSEAE